jgi:hypothetical protein
LPKEATGAVKGGVAKIKIKPREAENTPKNSLVRK